MHCCNQVNSQFSRALLKGAETDEAPSAPHFVWSADGTIKYYKFLSTVWPPLLSYVLIIQRFPSIHEISSRKLDRRVIHPVGRLRRLSGRLARLRERIRGLP